ncbi:maleylpyruvate isomerase family mycothiol-dependent enzyme [Nocardioides houyundeii]|uniref:maleylpyruvate isomerase family mycothiol-dependent enzyme n=1 Tax=Nocardioides houyundeii TaxID=2045452 RepID=UPI000DF4439A|nr:maleylpyruvate isomerase family mycothiol-dependent enzyme [Nocardioides houyundeii]
MSEVPRPFTPIPQVPSQAPGETPGPTSGLTRADYLRHLETESARFREVLEHCDPAAPVPSCPAWDASDLLWHLGRVQHFWAQVVHERPTAPTADDFAEPERPPSHHDLLGFFDQASADLLQALGGAAVADEAWTWSADHTVGFILRRQAHEALIHRLDAELAADSVTALDPRLAADGVHELLAVMYGGCPTWGRHVPGEAHVRVDTTDTDDQVWVNLARFVGTDPETGTSHDEEDVMVVSDPAVEPDAVIEGTAGALDAWLWHRSDDSEIRTAGDAEALGRLRRLLGGSID